MIQLYRTLGFDTVDIINGLSLDERINVNQNKVDMLEAADADIFIPYMPTETPMTFINQTPIPYDAMVNLYNKLEGQRLD